MKEYELSILFHPDLEMNLDPALDKVKKTITTLGGDITKEESDGKKRLAYKISGQEQGRHLGDVFVRHIIMPYLYFLFLF